MVVFQSFKMFKQTSNINELKLHKLKLRQTQISTKDGSNNIDFKFLNLLFSFFFSSF